MEQHPISSEIQKRILDLSALAISAHNTQPFRFEFKDSVFFIHVDPKCLLPTADPHYKDLWMSFGALYETLQIGLSEQNLDLKIIDLNENSNKPDTIACLRLFKSSFEKNSLAAFLNKRFSYRGCFSKINTEQFESLKNELKTVGFKVLTEEKNKKTVSELYNMTNLKFLSSRGYIEEFYSWLRFSSAHSRWAYDGMNAESISLNSIEAIGARWLLKPKVFRFLDKFRLAKILIDESPQIISAHFIVAMICPEQTSPFEKGRLFMRQWLELTHLGIFGAPLSLLTDDIEAIAKMKTVFNLHANETFTNILRCGVLPENYQRYKAARLPSTDLLWRPT